MSEGGARGTGRIVTVGIPTAGPPRLVDCVDGCMRLENMLIGKGFHWERALGVKLPGRVEVVDTAGKQEYSVLNHVPLETYLMCVVGSEMNPEAPPEFLKAHAVISRSWALGKILGAHPEDDTGRVDTPECLIGWDDTSAHTDFHVCSDDHCQRYQGVQPVSAPVAEAILSTEGVVLVDERGDVVDARFSKCCGGRTELFSTCWQDREMPGIESVEDEWCDLSSLPQAQVRRILKDYDLSTGGGYRWETLVSKREIEENLRAKFGRSVGRVQTIEALERGSSGRVKLLRIIGNGGALTLGKELWIRRLLSPTHLYSSAFSITDCGDTIRLTGRGWGHGAGLCQTGAAGMALAGADYRTILSHYYPHTHLLRDGVLKSI